MSAIGIGKPLSLEDMKRRAHHVEIMQPLLKKMSETAGTIDMTQEEYTGMLLLNFVAHCQFAKMSVDSVCEDIRSLWDTVEKANFK